MVTKRAGVSKIFKKWMPALTKCSLFKGIAPLELNLVLSCLNPLVHSFKKNEPVAVAGEKMSGLGLVLEGEVLVAKESAAGNRVIMSVDGPGVIFGEMAAFSPEGKWPATVIARRNTTIMFLHQGKIVGSCENACSSHQLLVSNMLGILSEKALLLNRKVEYLLIKSLRGKISAFLLEQYKKTGRDTFMLPMNRNELADFLNVTRPSLSREMSRLREEGVIDFHMESIKILQVDVLRGMVD